MDCAVQSKRARTWFDKHLKKDKALMALHQAACEAHAARIAQLVQDPVFRERRDWALSEGWTDNAEPAEAAEGPEDQQGGQRERRVDDFKARRLAGVGLRPGVALGVEDIGELPRQLGREGLQIEDRGDEIQLPQAEQGQQDEEGDGVPFHVGEECTGRTGVNSGYLGGSRLGLSVA